MSLDLSIYSNTPVLHRSTGVYIRENGKTKELATKQEVLTHFPDANPDDIKETTYEDNVYFHVNLTHNLTEMAHKCEIDGNCFNKESKSNKVSLYDLLWHPGDNLGIVTPSLDYLQDIMTCYTIILSNPNKFKKYNPSNGWGTYEQLVEATKNYMNALLSISTEFENYTIDANV